MNNYNRGYSYGNHPARNNSNRFSEDGPGAKRRKYRPAKKNQATPNIESLFKEPIAPPPVRSPSASSRQGGRGTANRSGTSYRASQYNQYSDYVSQNYSEPAWYWDNYYKTCQSWQEKHQLAYYRSRCLALEFENQMLFEQISSLVEENTIFAEERGEMPSMRLADLGSMREEVPAKKSQASNKPTASKNQGKKKPTVTVSSFPAEDDPTDANSSDLAYEFDQSTMELMETSLRHKISLKKIRKQEEVAKKTEADAEVNGTKTEGNGKQTAAELQQEMDQLYGKDSAQIHKLETSMQLKYNRFCDTHKPELWMAIPLNPVTVTPE